MATKRTLRSLSSNLKSIEGDINGILDDNEKLDEENISKLTGLMNMMLEKTNRFVQACEEVGETIEDGEFDQFVTDNYAIESKCKLLMNKADYRIRASLPAQQYQQATEASVSSNKTKSVALPKMKIKTFSGDPTEYQSFYQSFEEAIHKNTNLSNVEKMNYLVSLLEGEASECIKGLNLTNENYENARELLAKRFGDKQTLISAHMDMLLGLEAVDDEKDIKGLRKLFDRIESQVRSLEALDCKSDTFGPMLIPIVIKKLPNEFRLLVSRNTPGEVWNINDILKEFEKELSAREKISKDLFSHENSYSTTESLFVSQRHNSNREKREERKSGEQQRERNSPMCVFCRRSHASKNCDIITKPEVRRSILQRERRCFICMAANHMSSNCSKKWKCFKCGGRHNNAICTFKKKDDSKNDSQNQAPTPPATTQKTEPETTTTGLTSAKFQTVLLQTAVAKIQNGNHSENLRLLFDSGSQQTYISPEAKKLLKLETIDKKTVSIKSFGNGKSEKVLELVEFEVISKTGEKILVKALVSDICLPIENQPIEVAVKSYSHLQGIELADSNLYNSPLKIDILIGCKDYWRFVGSNQIKGTSGPVAVETKLGFILSGPVNENSGGSKTSVFSTHTMKCATSLSPDEQIRESYAKCFETNPKSNPNVQEILEEFESETIFKDGHYEVKLPFKEEITNLGDNYARSKSRLKNMVQRQFKDNPEFLKTYDDILQQQLSAGVIEKVEHYEIGQTHYLPHRPVVREDKQSTKVRIVFDASCKSYDGGFNLRKFKASDRELESIIYELSPEDKEFSSEQKVLGLNWDRNNDTIYFNFRELREKFVAMPTKRAILHNMASIYDPLGLISPLFVSFKTLFQEICEEKFDWDDILPDRLAERWEKILLEFTKIDKIEIDRPYCIESLHDNIKTVGAHIFSDASKSMYGAAVYLRFELESDSVKTALVSSKNRIISAKTLKSKHNTTPRNELNGILLATSHGPTVLEALKNSYEISETFYWTDSSIACAWVQSDKENEDSYVEDRVKKIKTVIKEPLSDLKLVPSEINPSDISTKVHYPLGLARNELWFYGPQFLTEKKNAWPDLKPGFSFKTDTTSVTATPASTDLSAAKINISEVIDYKRFNDFKKTSRVLAWAIRFVSKITLKKEEEDTIDTKQINNKFKQLIHNKDDCGGGGVLSTGELEFARNLLIEDSQRGLENDKNFPNLKKQLDLFQDERGLWRCGGRLENAELTYDQKHPLLIDNKHPIAKMVIRESHVNVMHNGVSQTLADLRKRFWITKPRNIIKRVIKECHTCRKHEGKPYGYPNEPALPRERVAANYAFQNMGIDYLGPVYVKDIYANSNETHKAWIAIATCTTTRAVYLDLVSDCSGPTCVNLLKRLASTHGQSKVMISDNGTNFISHDVQNFMANRGTLWKFNIEKAPWYGGFFERLVRSVKRCLRKSIENAKLNYEELLTVLKEVENILNNRPLTYLYTEENVDPLTPNKLIYGRDLNRTVTPSYLSDEENENNVDLDTRYAYLQKILDHFWNRWSNEYLVALRERSRKLSKTSNLDIVPKTDDIVLIHDDKTKRQNWKLGKVTKLIRSTDGNVRACELSVVTNGKLMKYKRPISKLYPFEYTRQNEDNDVIKFVDDKDILTFVAVAGVS